MYNEDVISNIYAPRLVQHMEVPSSSPVTTFYFEGLDGDNVQEYLLKYDLNVNISPSGITTPYIKFNYDATKANYYGQAHVVGNNGVDTHVIQDFLGGNSGGALYSTLGNHTGVKIRGELKFYPQTSDNEDTNYNTWAGALGRICQGWAKFGTGLTDFFKADHHGSWAGTGTITSVNMAFSGNGTGAYGTMELYELRRPWK